jgi:hypothetical protein
MALPVPTLDDRRFDDLVEEARALIPAYQPDWTDHNESDPGITLLELFAWLAEMLIYRADQVPERQLRAFLRLLNGPDWRPNGDLDADIRATVLGLRDEWRAITPRDYERIALASAARVQGARVTRAACFARRDLSSDEPAERAAVRPSHVSVVLVPVPRTAAAARELFARVAAELEPRRLLTAQVAVCGPVWTPVTARVLVTRPADVPVAAAEESVRAALGTLLDPVAGGDDGGGWPFGRSLYLSELVAVLERLREVDAVLDLDLPAGEGPAARGRDVRGTPLVADDGSPVGLALPPEALPRLDGVTVAGGSRLVPVRAAVAVTPPEGIGRDELRALGGRVVRAIRDLAWPSAGRSLTSTAVESAARAVAGRDSAPDAVLEGDADRVQRDPRDDSFAVRLGERELADLTVALSWR